MKYAKQDKKGQGRGVAMLKDRKVLVNDRFVEWQGATVHLLSHSFGRGSSIFEVLSLHATAHGPAVFRMDLHIARFFRSAAHLGMKLSLNEAQLAAAIRRTVRENRISSGFVKIIGYYGQPAFGILPPDSTLDLAILAVDPQSDLEGFSFPFETGTTACISTWHKLDPTTIPVEAKAAANYLNGMLARLEAKTRGFENVILLDTQGFVAEGPTESVFAVRQGVLQAPVLGTILDSITRRSILEVARAAGLRVREIRLARDMLIEADEIFLAGTPNKVLPVCRLEERTLAPVPGPVTRRISSLMNSILAGDEPPYRDWLFGMDEG
jgi:branched-chain amino acid aminotransferase